MILKHKTESTSLKQLRARKSSVHIIPTLMAPARGVPRLFTFQLQSFSLQTRGDPLPDMISETCVSILIRNPRNSNKCNNEAREHSIWSHEPDTLAVRPARRPARSPSDPPADRSARRPIRSPLASLAR